MMIQLLPLNQKRQLTCPSCDCCEKGEADAVLSAGSTGALLTAGLLLVKRIKQVSRPALMSTLPTADGRGFDMLDLGANTENTAHPLS